MTFRTGEVDCLSPVVRHVEGREPVAQREGGRMAVLVVGEAQERLAGPVCQGLGVGGAVPGPPQHP